MCHGRYTSGETFVELKGGPSGHRVVNRIPGNKMDSIVRGRSLFGGNFKYCEECWDPFLQNPHPIGFRNAVREREQERHNLENMQEDDSQRESERERLIPERLRWRLRFWKDSKDKPYYENILTGKWQWERPQALEAYLREELCTRYSSINARCRLRLRVQVQEPHDHPFEIIRAVDVETARKAVRSEHS